MVRTGDCIKELEAGEGMKQFDSLREGLFSAARRRGALLDISHIVPSAFVPRGDHFFKTGSSRLAEERKDPRVKVRLARHLWPETTMTLKWVTEALSMGSGRPGVERHAGRSRRLSS
jgi:hypothetical protein